MSQQRYVYKKYKIGYTPWSSESRSAWTYQTDEDSMYLYERSPTWDGNRYVTDGSKAWTTYGWDEPSNSELRCSYSKYSYDTWNPYWKLYEWEKTQYTRTRERIKGAFIEEIVAEDGTYPLNGIQDGYWYVRDRIAYPELGLKINGALKISDKAWVKVNGQLKRVVNIYIKINGALKEV